MIYKSTHECVTDLEKHGHLVRIKQEIDPDLEMAEIHRRVYQANGPAILFEKVKGSPFQAVSNLFGTVERSRFIFRHTLNRVKKLIQLKADPSGFFKNPFKYWDTPITLATALPKKVSTGPVFQRKTRIEHLPQIKAWPKDGGAFIYLPQVYTEDPESPSIFHSNLGMYRVQLSGNDYKLNEQIGLHYQIRRDIGVHHTKAVQRNEPLKVSIFIGGPPAHTFAAVMPLPEGLPEAAFAGALAGRRFRFLRMPQGNVVATEADFCITGTIIPSLTLPEGPFGDHLGYYSLKHNFPVMKVESVYHRSNAIWPFTIVGRPPQEDTSFGDLIHEITGPMVPLEIPGLKAVNAVDQAGVHPLLLAIGSERYTPYEKREPKELLTLSNAILGFGPLSLAKYLFIVAEEDNPNLDIHNFEDFFTHLLSRVDWRKDLHFQTRTTIDTLDYSGSGLNAGSKVVIAAAGDKKRELSSVIPARLQLPTKFKDPQIIMPGILAIKGPGFTTQEQAAKEITSLCRKMENQQEMEKWPLVIVVDDSEFTSRNHDNFLWVTFTRSNPSHDIYGVKAFTEYKHWGCEGTLIIDARIKTHHAPPLVEDSAVTQKIDKLAVMNGPLYGII